MKYLLLLISFPLFSQGYFVKNISCYNTDQLHIEHNEFGQDFVIYEVSHPEARYWQVQMDVALSCGGGQIAIQDDINKTISKWYGSLGDVKGYTHILNGKEVASEAAVPFTFLSPYLSPETLWQYNEQDMLRYTVRTRKNKLWIVLYFHDSHTQIAHVKFKCNHIETWTAPQDLSGYDILGRQVQVNYSLPQYTMQQLRQ